MKKLLIILLISSLVIGNSISIVEAGIKTKAALGIGAAVLATGAVLTNAQIHSKGMNGRYNYLYRHQNQVQDYLSEYPEDKEGLLDIVNERIQFITRINNQNELKIANQFLNLISGELPIPPTVVTNDNGHIIHDNPIDNENQSTILDNPITDEDQENIIYTPTGEPVNTLIDYPYEDIKTWDEYLLFKQDSKDLADNMEKAGMGRRPQGYSAHHMIPATSKKAQDARDILKNHGIHFNDAINGVYLPGKSVTSPTSGIIHNGSHPDKYIEKVTEMIDEADRRGGKSEVIKELANIKYQLETANPNSKWGDVLK